MQGKVNPALNFVGGPSSQMPSLHYSTAGHGGITAENIKSGIVGTSLNNGGPHVTISHGNTPSYNIGKGSGGAGTSHSNPTTTSN